MSVKCPKCHSDNPDDTIYCGKCATPLKATEEISITKTLITPKERLQKGSIIAGKYQILEELGRGGMGIVYKAEDTKLKRTIALKFLPLELMRETEARERFIQEAQAAASLNHPNICTVHEIDEADGHTFIAMEYLVGQSLKQKISSGPMKIEEALDTVVQIAEGLQEAHENGIVHRDIKPANIMLTKKGQVKIMDFGLAKLTWGVDLTKTATIMGTVAYMSPEQAKGEKVDLRTDIWSLGCVLYEMLSGERPFKSLHDQAVIYSILKVDPKSISKLRENVPSELDHSVLKCLEKDPNDRYKNMASLYSDLKYVSSRIKSFSSPKSITEKKPSIAILPFVNMSADPENEYFSDGLAEELINALTRFENLRVVARTSSFAFKGEKIDIREVGQRLNVKTLLEGSVRKAGKRVRVTAQLVNVEDGYHIWSERYDRDLEDVFAVQDEITIKIIDKLKADLELPKKIQEKRHSENLEAYDLYLKGRYYINRLSPELVDKTISCYKQALEKDPDYALVYVGLAEAYGLLSIGFDILPSKDTMPKAREAAEKALQLDPALAEAHAALALIATFYDWDRKTAEKCYQKAFELNPNSASAHMWSELYYSFLEGNFDKALAEINRAQELDPLNLLIKLRVGYVHYYMRDFDRAIDQFKEIIDLEPKYAIGYHGLMDAYGQKGLLEKAIEAGEKELELGVPAVAFIGVLGLYYALAGRKTEAYNLLNELLERSKKGYVSSFWVGTIYHGLGETGNAFEWFERAFEERDCNLTYITTTPPFDSIRPDPRFQQLLIKMGLDNLLEK